MNPTAQRGANRRPHFNCGGSPDYTSVRLGAMIATKKPNESRLV
jgi:hypothetical protein